MFIYFQLLDTLGWSRPNLDTRNYSWICHMDSRTEALRSSSNASQDPLAKSWRENSNLDSSSILILGWIDLLCHNVWPSATLEIIPWPSNDQIFSQKHTAEINSWNSNTLKWDTVVTSSGLTYCTTIFASVGTFLSQFPPSTLANKSQCIPFTELTIHVP